MSSLTIHLEIGHEASLRTKITTEGFTHDWEVFVRGVNNADIHQYVDKVVFHLHETFIKPKRVVKEPPYSLKTSGYAGFNLPIEIYLRNNQEPRKIKFNYDLHLQPNGPTLYKVQKEKYVFNSPSDEFRTRLLKGGAVVGSGDVSESRAAIDDKNQMTSKPKLSAASLDALKKPKYRPDMNRDSFHNLFGTPITKTNKPEVVKPKEQSQSKSQPMIKPEKEKSKNKSPHKEKEKKASSNESKSKEERKSKEKPKEHDRPREKKREKSRDRSSTPKEKDRKEEKKSKKREHKENKHRERDKSESHKEHKSRDVKPVKENHVSKEIKESSPFPQQKTEKKDKVKEEEVKPRVEEKSKHKYKKKDKERKEKKEEKRDKTQEKKAVIKENGKEQDFGISNKSSLFDSPKSEEPKKAIVTTLDESSASSRSSSREPSPIPIPIPEPIEIRKVVHENNVEAKKIKDEVKEKKKEKREKKRDKKLEKEHEKKRKRKLESEMSEMSPPEKKHGNEDFVNNNSDDERKVSSSEDAALGPTRNEPQNEDYMGMLRNLQHKIMGLRDNSDLQRVVQLIAETGRYEVSQHTFDFDLCLLEPSTVRQLQDFFSTIS